MYKSGFVHRWEQRREEFKQRLEELVLEDWEMKLKELSGEMNLQNAKKALDKNTFEELMRYDQEAMIFQDIGPELAAKTRQIHTIASKIEDLLSKAERYLRQRFERNHSSFRKANTIKDLQVRYNQMQDIAGFLGKQEFSDELRMAESRLQLYKKRSNPTRRVRNMRRAATFAIIACLAGAGYAGRDDIQSWMDSKISAYYANQSRTSQDLDERLGLSYKALQRDERNREALSIHNDSYERYIMRYGQADGQPDVKGLLKRLRMDSRTSDTKEPFLAIEHIIQATYAQDEAARVHHYREAMNQDRHLLAPYYSMARIHAEHNDRQNLLKMMESAYRVAPDNRKICLEYGWALFVNRQFLDAADILSEAVDDRSGADFHGALGVSLVYTGRAEQGKPHLESAVDKDPDDPAWQTHLGALYYQQGDLAGARSHLYIAYKNGGDPSLRKTIENINSRLQEQKK